MSSAFSLTTTTCLTGCNARAVSSTCVKSGRPASGWSALGRAERIRVPPPAVRMTMFMLNISTIKSVHSKVDAVPLHPALEGQAPRLESASCPRPRRHHARGFSGYRGAHLCARSHEFFFGLLPSESGQCAGERDDLAGERFFSLFCVLSLAFRPMHPGGA